MAKISNPTQHQKTAAWYHFWRRFPKGWFTDGDFNGVYYTPVTGKGAYAMMNWELSFHHGNDKNTATWERYNRDLARKGVHLKPIFQGDTPHGLHPLPDDVEANYDIDKEGEEEGGEEEEFEGFPDSPRQG